MKIQFVLLADSYKCNGHCIAGKIIPSNKWIRPVNTDINTGLSDRQISYEDGSLPKLLDIIEIDVLRADPLDNQTENYIINENETWIKIGEYPITTLDLLVDKNISFLQYTENSSTKMNTRINTSFVQQNINNSLLFVKIPKAEVSVIFKDPENDPYRKDTILKFNLLNKLYEIPIKYKNNPYANINIYPIDKAFYATISLALDYYDYCYLVIAGLIL